jgi:hypothetical protein
VNVYVWEDLDGLTDSWHDGGGVLVVAESLDRARALIPGKGDRDYEPDLVLPVAGDTAERVIVFPNAGCC